MEKDEYKILDVKKRYNKELTKTVVRAIFNASMIAFLGTVVLNSGANASEVGVDIFDKLYQQAFDIASKLPGFNIALIIFSKLHDIGRDIIGRIGIGGYLLISQAVKLITNVVKDTAKTLKVKKELNELKKKCEKKQEKKREEESKKSAYESIKNVYTQHSFYEKVRTAYRQGRSIKPAEEHLASEETSITTNDLNGKKAL